MKALIIDSESRLLYMAERDDLQPAAGEVRISVNASGINRPDIYQCKGNYPAPPGVPADIPGLEVAGCIDKVGADVTDWKVGDEVCALVAGGGYATQVVVDARQVLPVPEGLTMAQAASLCETYFTVWSNLVDRGKFSAGVRVLIHGGSSGIGVSAIQLINALGGEVYTTAGSSEKCQFCESLGATVAINYKEQDFEQILREAVGKLDLVLDMVGGDYTPRNLRLLDADGRLVLINAMAGRMAEVDLLLIMRNRLTLTGSTLRARNSEFKGAIRDALVKQVWPLIASEEILPIVYRTFPAAKINEAHTVMESSRHMGKLIIQWSEE